MTAEVFEKCRLSDRELRELRDQIKRDEQDEGLDSGEPVKTTRQRQEGPKGRKRSSVPPRRSI